ncbi:transcriptional regulator [Clostridium zeae]|uniref:Transcriptional regulator n=1 Tax=Clostridium zeae TaxID=2759022 RepID=A0ABQ1E5I4_9CLOT|nr:class I SAM-dependent methyltransferase [Clostridium zeae]GFZ29993.1 transcriptional regulator [Clostridium zeae]
MSMMDKVENVKEQYRDGNNLAKRTNLHVKHSTNKQGFVPWLFEKYEFSKGDRILEIGCGNGTQWENRIHLLPEDCTLVLSDFSEGMVKVVWEKYSGQKNMLAQKLDIQNIPFPDNCFDVIVANHMLYHVPDLPKALSEVKRVLKNGGKFYAATNGNGGMRTYLRDAFKEVNPDLKSFTKDISFTLQNGQSLLIEYFDDVQRYDYEDSLSITETQDLIDWLKSTVTIATYADSDLNGFYEYFEAIRQKEGAINIPKEAGLFVSTKV